MPDMVMNIQADSGRPTYLKLKLTLEMQDAELAAHLQEEMPRMQDMFQSFLRELRPEDLAGSVRQLPAARRDPASRQPDRRPRQGRRRADRRRCWFNR
jgi:hypothetical protein